MRAIDLRIGGSPRWSLPQVRVTPGEIPAGGLQWPPSPVKLPDGQWAAAQRPRTGETRTENRIKRVALPSQTCVAAKPAAALAREDKLGNEPGHTRISLSLPGLGCVLRPLPGFFHPPCNLHPTSFPLPSRRRSAHQVRSTGASAHPGGRAKFF